MSYTIFDEILVYLAGPFNVESKEFIGIRVIVQLFEFFEVEVILGLRFAQIEETFNLFFGHVDSILLKHNLHFIDVNSTGPVVVDFGKHLFYLLFPLQFVSTHIIFLFSCFFEPFTHPI